MKDKRYTKITKERLDECLKSIGWSTRHYGCNCYYIINQYGKPTKWMFTSKKYNTPIYEISLDAEFGEGHKYSNGGSCVFKLKGCHLTVTDGMVSIIANSVKDCEQPVFLSFYGNSQTTVVK